MSMKKGYCTACKTRDEAKHIFDVNSDSKVCYCPRCMKKYRPRVAIHNYERVINHYLRRANFFLKNAGEPKLAYSLFAYILELEPANKSAKLGRMLSLAYISTLRRNRFSEVKELMIIEKDQFRALGIRKEYIAYLLSLEHCLNTYINKVKKKLMFKGYFYDQDCFSLYLKHVHDVIELKRFIIAEFSAIDQEKMCAAINKTIKTLEGEYNKSVYVVNGEELHLSNFTKEGEPLITAGKKKEMDPRLEKYRMSTLDPANKKLKVIKDSVFSQTPSRLYFTYHLAIILVIVMGALALTSFITFFITINYWFSGFFMAFFIIFGLLTGACAILRLITSLILKKPRI